jgi:hypothetical protein
VIRFRFRAELRTRWRASLVLGLLIGVIAGGTLAATAATRRTHSAYARYLDAIIGVVVLEADSVLYLLAPRFRPERR